MKNKIPNYSRGRPNFVVVSNVVYDILDNYFKNGNKKKSKNKKRKTR